MKSLKNMVLSAGLITFVGATSYSFADDIDADDFVDEASAKGIAEVEASKLALQKSSSSAVKTFAQQMINDHTKANSELAALAKRKNLEVATEAELKSKAKAFILKQRDGESFDEAYANNQVMAHEETIALFKEGSNTDDADINSFAKTTLPKLEHHLMMAKELATKTKAANSDNDSSAAHGSGVHHSGANHSAVHHSVVSSQDN